MDRFFDPLWDERGELRRGCTVGQALAWLTECGSHSAGETVYINGETYKIGRLLYGPDRPAIADKTISRVCDGYYHSHAELRAGQRLVSNAVPLLDDELTLGLILESQSHSTAFLDLDGLGLGINDESVRCLGLSDHNALAGLQPLNADLAIFIGAVNAIGIANQQAVRIGDLEFRILQGEAGVDGTNLAHQQDSVRGVLESNGDNTLFATVCQIDGFRGLKDAVAICGIHFLQNISAGLQASPDGSAVFAGHLLTDDGSARTGGTAQIAEDKSRTGQNILRNTVILLHDDGDRTLSVWKPSLWSAKAVSAKYFLISSVCFIVSS